jgi:protein-L-isoaspartate(D-aspartate) O-methyltransferase
MNIEQARDNMIKQQLRTWNVLDAPTLNIIAKTPREYFVPENYKDLAFADMAIPLAHDQVMLTPKEEARLLQALNIQPTEVVLEVGTGSGYMTALLAGLAHFVYSVDIFADFSVTAKLKLAKCAINNIQLITADAAFGYNTKAPYDVIIITGSLPFLPESFRYSLKPGGRILAILGKAPAMEATLLTYHQQGAWSEQKLFETVVPPLLHAPERSLFTF